jgi:hypothetical protein
MLQQTTAVLLVVWRTFEVISLRAYSRFHESLPFVHGGRDGNNGVHSVIRCRLVLPNLYAIYSAVECLGVVIELQGHVVIIVVMTASASGAQS